MKIHGSDEISKSIYCDKTDKNKASGKADFANILKERVEKPFPQIDCIQSATLVSSLHPVQMSAIYPQDKSQTVDRLGALLDLLDAYRQKLAHPQTSLKDIHPLISAIGKETEKMEAALETLAEEDELKHIVNQTLVTASLEVIKFNRGDYITS
jgi:hypothetical protein